MSEMQCATVDAVVTDPPYGLSFMGKGWDHGVPGVEFWTAALRVLKPGAHLLAFGGTRTYHRLACAIEDAGFEVKDCLTWLYGQGFPKHRSLLKPAWEPIILARKRGPGMLNIDACRLEGAPPSKPQPVFGSPTGQVYGFQTGEGRNGRMSHAEGRWPANVILDEPAAEMLDQMSGERTSGRLDRSRITAQNKTYGACPTHRVGVYEPDTGGASRFYYVAKASRRERNAGLDGMPERALNWSSGEQSPGTFQSEGTNRMVANPHPTVKPIALMRWLCRLVTPPGGLILDPFMGSGSTGCAAVLEGFRFVGTEQDPEYAAIAERRIEYWQGEREEQEAQLALL
jgi:site-specific DNA-methyltransferase (adenine-specific)